MDQDFVKKRLEKDLEDLKRMIALHFEQRKKDENELEELKSRIDKRKQMREEQLRLRAERERERQEFGRLEKERKAEEEMKKKEAMVALSTSFGGYKSQAKSRTNKADREKKKKELAERRKPLNIDHLPGDKIQEKINEMYKYLCQLEEERSLAEIAADPAKHEVTIMRTRVYMVMQKLSKKKK